MSVYLRNFSKQPWQNAGRAILSLALLSATAGASVAADNWTYWRGPTAQGVAPQADYPIKWTVPQDVLWRTPLAGKGGSTPIVAGNQVFLTMGAEEKNQLLAFDATTGDQQWQVALGDDTGGKHNKGSGANPSPVTDGQYVYAYYRSGDLGCVDVRGQVVWQRNLQKDFGEDTLWWDLGSSPLLTDKALVVAVMQSPPGPSYLAGFDRKTGDLLWKVERELKAPSEAAQSYTSPLAATVDGRDVIVVLGADHLTVHDANDGKMLGQVGGFNPESNGFFRSIASPVVAGNIVICPYARGDSLTAIDMSKVIAGAGRDAILWEHWDEGADVPTPAVMDGVVYICRDRGDLLAMDVKTGELRWEMQLPRSRMNYSSSPLLTRSHLYLLREDNQVMVVALPRGDGEPELVAENGLGGTKPYAVASPVPVGDALLFRTSDELVRVGK